MAILKKRPIGRPRFDDKNTYIGSKNKPAGRNERVDIDPVIYDHNDIKLTAREYSICVMSRLGLTNEEIAASVSYPIEKCKAIIERIGKLQLPMPEIEVLKDRLKSMLPGAIRVIEQIIYSDIAAPSVRYNAAKDLLSAYNVMVTKEGVSVDEPERPKEIEASIKRLIAKGKTRVTKIHSGTGTG